MISGLFYGFSFGLGGLGAAVLGVLADHFGIVFVYKICAFLPLLGLFAAFLPGVRPPNREGEKTESFAGPAAAL
jgi:FSR family fosmidomycin resistance protein-like MFS transporter